MNIPRLPSRFRQGDRLRASDLNLMLDWMEAVARKLPSLQVTTGPDLNYTRSSSGTVISLARGFAQTRPRVAAEYEHPFKVTAGFKNNILRIHIAPGQWCRLLSPTTANYLNNGVLAADFTLSESDLNNSTSVNACLFIPAIASAVLPGHFEPGEPISSLEIYKDDLQFSVPASGIWTINLAKILIDWNEAKASVVQYWNSDLLPLWIHPQHLPVTKGD